MITPEQLRNAARFGQTLRPETLEWLASRLEYIDTLLEMIRAGLVIEGHTEKEKAK